MTDAIANAQQVVLLLEDGDAAAVLERVNERIRASGWSAEDYLRELWRPSLLELAGSTREVVGATPLPEGAVRLVVAGERGQAFVTVRLDETGRIGGLGVAADTLEGIHRIVIGSPDGPDGPQGRRMADMYHRLIPRDPTRKGNVAIDGDGWSDLRPPRWPDPEFPQQLHLDVLVADVGGAGDLVEANGATLLRDHGEVRIYADPVGHPFCLYADPSRDAEPGAPPGVIGRIVVDCPEPRDLASFYGRLLDMPRWVEDTPDRVVIGYEDGRLPMLAFQRSDNVAPRWPDPAYPAQLHLDLDFDDGPAVEVLARRLGAVPLPAQGGSCAVYADPAGHPFCLCMPGQ